MGKDFDGFTIIRNSRLLIRGKNAPLTFKIQGRFGLHRSRLAEADLLQLARAIYGPKI